MGLGVLVKWIIPIAVVRRLAVVAGSARLFADSVPLARGPGGRRPSAPELDALGEAVPVDDEVVLGDDRLAGQLRDDDGELSAGLDDLHVDLVPLGLRSRDELGELVGSPGGEVSTKLAVATQEPATPWSTLKR
jgi:hypothetical protein